MDFFKRHIRLFLPAILLCATLGAPVSAAYAREELFFGQNIRQRPLLFIHNYIREVLENAPEDYAIARADLNKDGRDEYILRSSECSGVPVFCRYIVLAQGDGRMVKLGDIQARNLMLSDRYDHGVRAILVFFDPNNDFLTKLYIWDHAQSQYILEE